MDKITCRYDDEADLFTAKFPAAYSGNRGVMTVEISYHDNHHQNTLTSTKAYYKGKITVDGVEVFTYDDIGAPIKSGRGVDSPESYLDVLPAVVSFGSAFEGSGHGEICNENPRAIEFSAVFDMANDYCFRLSRALGMPASDHGRPLAINEVLQWTGPEMNAPRKGLHL